MSSPDGSVLTPPVVHVITVSPTSTLPSDPGSTQTCSSSSPRHGERRLARGFTITVSAPPEEEIFEESSLSHQGSWGSNAEGIGVQPREKSWERDYLAPDGKSRIRGIVYLPPSMQGK